MPQYPLEFAKNKLLLTGFPSQMYLVIDWCVVKYIPDPIAANTLKAHAFPLPGFDEVSFPFILVDGLMHLSIFNVASHELKPLTNGMTQSGKPGLRFAFAMGDLSEIQVHYALRIQDRDGHGKELFQYSYLTLKHDIIAQLKETGRLPIHTRLDYK